MPVFRRRTNYTQSRHDDMTEVTVLSNFQCSYSIKIESDIPPS